MDERGKFKVFNEIEFDQWMNAKIKRMKKISFF